MQCWKRRIPMRKKRAKIKAHNDKLGLIIALMVTVAIFTIFNEHYFSVTNFINILVAASLMGLVAIGETYLVIGGLVDLSAGSVAAFASVLASVLLSVGIHWSLAILIVVLSGVIVGSINALAVNKLKLEPFIATLATMSIMRGFAYIICGGKPVYIRDSVFLKIGSYRIFGWLPIPVLFLIIMFVLLGIVLAKTRFGRNVYVLGGNKYAARLAGLHPQRIVIALYVITAVLASLGGVILGARMNSGQPSAAVGLEFDAITAAVLGGTAFSGGVGTIFGTALGVLILQGFNTGLIMLNVPAFWQFVARGLLLLVALAFDYFRKMNREKKILEASMENK